VTPLAMSTGVVVLAWIGLAIGLAIAVVVVLLFNRIVRPAQEIESYANDILDSGLAIARNLDGADELLRTRELATAVPPLAVAYLKRLGAA
jgi:tetrahydromethanopterin S-methyltransferase subunit F